ncbi:L-threonylcarbamoyladenylate synthase, partial [Myxococcota bacterium]
VHVSEPEAVKDLAYPIPTEAQALMECFWPGPLTLVLRKRDAVPDLVTAGLATVGLRMPDHPVALDLLRQATVPVCAPSANPFGYVSPTTVHHVAHQLGTQVDALLDGGPCRIGLESTIVSLAEERPILLRPGGTPLEPIETLLGRRVVKPGRQTPAQAPGMFGRHYSPRSPVTTFAGTIPPPPSGRAGLMLLAPRIPPPGYALVEVLSPLGDLTEIASRLFAVLRAFDQAQLDWVLAELAPEQGLGAAINDRLTRAAGSRPSGVPV